MGITAIKEDFITAIMDVLDEVGDTLTIKYHTEGALDENDPGAGKPQTEVTATPEGILVVFDESFMEGTEVEQGDRIAIISVAGLSFEITQGMFVIAEGKEYRIVHANSPQVSGGTVVVFAQVRG